MNNFLKTRKGVSQIIGSLFMLAIVATFGSIFMFQGLEGVRNFTDTLNVFDESESLAIQENLIIEHVRLVPDQDDALIWIRNTGNVDITLDRLTMVKIDTQDLIMFNDTASDQIFPKEVKLIGVTGSSISLPAACSNDRWDDDVCEFGTYTLSVTTSRGNSFTTYVQPFNT